MKPAEAALVHHVERIHDSVQMSIDQESLVHLMGILTDLYSDPILAVIREYSTNAIDSHIEAGTDAPIEVTLPSGTSHNFVVKDYGVGLSVDEIRDTFSMYGRSTKRENNDVAGVLGLGCKSGLTYALSFTVTGIKEGIRTTAVVTKDAQGIGTIKILDTKATSEPNGVTISIPTKSHDEIRFHDRAREFFRYWRRNTVLVDGEAPTFDVDTIWLDDDVAVIAPYSQSKIVMGNVAYPFEPQWKMLHSIIAYVPMGSVQFTPSREALHYTAMTKDTIATLMEYVKERFTHALLEKMDQAATPYERIELAGKWRYAELSRKSTATKLALRDLTYPVNLHRRAWKWRGDQAESVQRHIGSKDFIAWDTIVVGFPFKTLSAKHRERLRQCEIKKCLILPDDTDISPLEGKPGLIHWDDIVRRTPDVKTPESARQRAKTTYEVAHGCTRYHTERITGGVPIAYENRQYWYGLQERYPEVHVAILTTRQVDRFRRLHPTAIPLSEYQDRERRKAIDALTQRDRIHVNIEKHAGLFPYADLGDRLDEIQDSQLRNLVEIAISPKGTAVDRATRLNVEVQLHPIHATIQQRYPLARHSSHLKDEELQDELLFYVNSKWAMLTDNGRNN